MKQDRSMATWPWKDNPLRTLDEPENRAREADHRLISACLEGQPQAFGALVLRYQDRLYTAVFSVVQSVEDSQDVVQEAFLHAYQHLGSFKGDAQFYTWLYRIAMNAAHSLQRKRVVRSIMSWIDNLNIELADPSEAAQPDQGLEQAEQIGAVQEALSQLSGEHRTMLVMKDMEGMKYEDMAETLGLPIGTIRSRLHRARLELRALLEKGRYFSCFHRNV
jgi:RNA polymerase sigma-70 factor (ECF subfamily)